MQESFSKGKIIDFFWMTQLYLIFEIRNAFNMRLQGAVAKFQAINIF
jgi:hypothetical protein